MTQPASEKPDMPETKREGDSTERDCIDDRLESELRTVAPARGCITKVTICP